MTGLFDNPTVLRYPTWYGGTDDMPLPLTPDAYAVQQVEPDRWAVTVIATGEEVYRSIGPVWVTGSDVPF
jgi:hypothetical protein